MYTALMWLVIFNLIISVVNMWFANMLHAIYFLLLSVVVIMIYSLR